MPSHRSPSGRPVRAAALVFTALFMALSSAQDARAENYWEICARAIVQAEQQADLPPHLLTAISKGESGRWHAETGSSRAWPWTVTAQGKGRFLPSKAAAIAEVRRLQAEGIRNIDVGCMQINLRYHPQAFESLETAFDPVRNIDYAAAFLSGLREDYRSWIRAIGYYHSKTPHLSNAYRRKVAKLWREERRQARLERRQVREAERAAANQVPEKARERRSGA